MIFEIKQVGPLKCNAILLGCEETKEGVIIDPGDEGPMLLAWAHEKGVHITHLLHTHAHFDHIGATKYLKDNKKEAYICLHSEDEFLYSILKQQGDIFGFQFEAPPPIDRFIDEGDIISFGSANLKIIHTPGHSPGSVSFIFETSEQGIIFCGDTLFYRSIGRTDLWGGSEKSLFTSIQNKILTFDDAFTIVPGHGPITTIFNEKKNNPYLK